MLCPYCGEGPIYSAFVPAGGEYIRICAECDTVWKKQMVLSRLLITLRIQKPWDRIRCGTISGSCPSWRAGRSFHEQKRLAGHDHRQSRRTHSLFRPASSGGEPAPAVLQHGGQLGGGTIRGGRRPGGRGRGLSRADDVLLSLHRPVQRRHGDHRPVFRSGQDGPGPGSGGHHLYRLSPLHCPSDGSGPAGGAPHSLPAPGGGRGL